MTTERVTTGERYAMHNTDDKHLLTWLTGYVNNINYKQPQQSRSAARESRPQSESKQNSHDSTGFSRTNRTSTSRVVGERARALLLCDTPSTHRNNNNKKN